MIRRVRAFVIKQLRQGASPQGLALSVAVGVFVGCIPILGTTTALCFLFGFVLRLNHPTLQAINYIMYPIQILLIPGFLRLGEFVFQEPHISFSLKLMLNEFAQSPLIFAEKYGLAALGALGAWLLVSIILGPILFFILKNVFGRMRTVNKN